MARITGYGQSGRIEWDRPVEFYSAQFGESTKDYMRRVCTSREEIEITRRLLNRHKDEHFQIDTSSRNRSITTRQMQGYFARYAKKVFDLDSIFEA
mgnify:FL=1